MTAAPARAVMIGCLPFDASTPGFALPIFRDQSGQGAFYLQHIDEITNRIDGFKRFEEAHQFIKTPAEICASVGDETQFAFIDGEHRVFSGALKELEPVLRAFLINSPQFSGICLQVAELIGSTPEKLVARARMRRTIRNVSGVKAANSFYERSVTLTEIWRCLISSAPTKAAAKRILNARGSIRLIEKDGMLSVDLADIQEHDFSSQALSELMDTIRTNIEAEHESLGVDTGEFSHRMGSWWDYFNHGRATPPPTLSTSTNEVLLKLKQAAWQEERVAIIFSELLGRPNIGRNVLKRYSSEKAKFALEMIAEAKSELKRQPAGGDVSYERLVQHLVNLAIKVTFPMNLGKLLFQFAKHMGRNLQINEILKHKLQSSESMSVNEWRHRIEDLLNNTRPPAIDEEVSAIAGAPTLRDLTTLSADDSVTGLSNRVARRPGQHIRMSPFEALMMLDVEINRRVKQALAAHGQLSDNSTLSTIEGLIALERWGFPKALISVAKMLVTARNELAHGSPVNERTILAAVDAGVMVLDALRLIPAERHIVYRVDVPLFKDDQGTEPLKDVVGVILKRSSPDGGIDELRIFPTSKRDFQKGQAVSWEWDTRKSWGTAWYRNPDSDKIEKAWDQSLEFVGRDLEKF